MQRALLRFVAALIFLAHLAGPAAALVTPDLTNDPAKVASQQAERIARLEQEIATAKQQSADASRQIAEAKTAGVLKVVDMTIGLRVAPEHELLGLDTTQHGEEGYYWDASPSTL